MSAMKSSRLRRFALFATVAATAALAGERGSAPTLPPTATIDLGGGVTMAFVLIRPGSFLMGSEENTGGEDESPVHPVTLTQPFYLGRFEVTQEQWAQVMDDNPSGFTGPKLPVDSVSWDDCQRFLAKLAERTGRKFALPTEAQWEYACRAGTTTRWSFGDNDAVAGDHGWIAGNSGGGTYPVGGKKPNPWGLYDMYGNVWEWCADWYAKHAYPAGAVTDPTGPATGASRVLRGGGWGVDPDNARSACRNCAGPESGHNGTGFRCVMLVEEAPP
jgi:formylglycine-generating enzyme required for sulfatase activity